MGQEFSSSDTLASHSILEPLSVSIVESSVSCSQRREQADEQFMDQAIIAADQDEFVKAILAITESADSTHDSLHPHMGVSCGAAAELDRMRSEAEKDFQQWKQARKLMRRDSRNLTRHDSSTSTASSSIYQEPVRPLVARHTYISDCRTSTAFNNVAVVRRDSSPA